MLFNSVLRKWDKNKIYKFRHPHQQLGKQIYSGNHHLPFTSNSMNDASFILQAHTFFFFFATTILEYVQVSIWIWHSLHHEKHTLNWSMFYRFLKMFVTRKYFLSPCADHSNFRSICGSHSEPSHTCKPWVFRRMLPFIKGPEH